MSRSTVVLPLAMAVGVVGCGAVAGVLAPKIASVTVSAPAGLLVGDSAQATSNALGQDGKTHNGLPVTWRSSDPTALSIDPTGRILALAGGRTVTITAEVEGTSGSARVAVASGDDRFGYALADQPSATGTYVPVAETRYNSGGGTVEVTRTGPGVYSVRFAGLGRAPGQRDNVQVSAYGATPTLCKPKVWDADGPDLTVAVSCFGADGTPEDSRFTILALGAWAFGRTAPLAFALSYSDSGAVVLDSTATARNSTGGHVLVGRVGQGSFAVQFPGLETQWSSGHVAIQLTAVGGGPRRCRAVAVDPASAGIGVSCTTPAGGAGDSPFSVLWLQHGRPAMRFGYAWAENLGATTDYIPYPDFLINSSNGSITARKTGPGQYKVVFAGLGRPAGATETVLVAPFLSSDRICDIGSWGNTGANDLFVDVLCFDASSSPADARFSVMVAE